ncbi:hypothetical protein H2200_006475 [Cladophialophora chaetospira]|uniref:Uncharacterized protein n=1 Tax=Cladophialophora chaetospira TaxID=386627 RepID=A0AA38X8G0_9EURO|nr:hypothetical protein H2200_006475 [Cladophialophora chaetospira]
MQRRAAHHQQRDRLAQSPRTIPAGSASQANALQRLIRETESSLMIANAPLSAKPAEFFYSTVLDAFQPRREVGVFSGDRLPVTPADGNFSSVALCIRGLLPLAKPAERQVLDTALFSLLAIYLGRLIKDAKMTLLACSAYTSAVREFRLLLASRFAVGLESLRADYCQSFLALSTALQLFEIPALLAETDDLLSSIESASEAASLNPNPDSADLLSHLNAAETLIDKFAKITLDLDQWLRDFEDWYNPAPLYWETDDVLNNAYALVDAQCIPKHDGPKHILRFRDGQKAGALICYWAIRLEILMSLIDMKTAVSTLLAPTQATAMRAITICQNLDADKAAADTMASLMLQSLPYLECCLEGVFVAQLPMRIVHRYFTRHRLNSSQPNLPGGRTDTESQDTRAD